MRTGPEFERALLARATDGVVVLDPNGHIAYASRAAERMLGYEPDATIGAVAFELVHPDDQISALEGFQSTFGSRDSRPLPLLLRLRRADGTWLQTEVIGTNHLEDPQIAGMLLEIRDVSFSMRTEASLRESEERHRLIVELARDGICSIDVGGRIIFANRALSEMLDTTVAQLVGRPAEECFGMPPLPVEAGATLLDVLEDPQEYDVRLTSSRGRHVWARFNASPITDHAGRFLGAVVVATDVTERRTLEENLALAVRRDALTGASNRVELFEVLGDRMSRGQPVACLYVDLDHFKDVNDRYGHAVGDHVLRIATARIRAAVRPADLVSRVGGDEFVVVCGTVAATDAPIIAERICEELRKPFGLGDLRITISASVGIAVGLGGSADDVLRTADHALYQAKRNGRNTVCPASGPVTATAEASPAF